MSIALDISKFDRSSETVTAPGVVITAEGQALVRANATQSAGVLPSTGASTDIFVGFALAGTSALPFPEPYFNKVETFVVPTGGSIGLAFTPVAGQVGIYDVTTGAAVPITGGVTLVGNIISGLTVADTVNVTYKYAMTVLQRQALMGDVQPGGYSGAYVNQIGLAKAGIIYTSEFDDSVNWLAATGVKLAANGQLTSQAGSGVSIPATIIAVPGIDYPYLGLSFAAAN